MLGRCAIVACVFLSASALGLLPVLGASGDALPVKGKLLGKNDKKSEDASGIACVPSPTLPLHCLVVDDELQDAQFVEVRDDKIQAGAPIHLIDDSFQGKALSLDGEGVAYTQADFYVIGSHGHPRDRQHKLDPQRDAAEIAAKIAASSKIVRITETPGGPHVEVSTKLHAFIAADPILAPFADHRLDENGVTVEGIAIKGDRLFASFRQPSIHGNETPILSVKIDALFGSGAPDLRLDLLPIGVGLGVRDLAAFRDGLRILAGPAADAEGEYSVSWWSGQGRELKRLLTLPPILEEGAPVHPEAILPIAQQGQKLRVVVLSDGAKEGGPRVFDIDAP